MNREKHRAYYKAYMRDIRLRALRIASGNETACCGRCGFSDSRALQIDHIDGCGAASRKQRQHTRLYLDIVRGRNTVPVQVLCANCNWIKRHENNEALGRPRFKESQSLLFEKEYSK